MFMLNCHVMGRHLSQEKNIVLLSKMDSSQNLDDWESTNCLSNWVVVLREQMKNATKFCTN